MYKFKRILSVFSVVVAVFFYGCKAGKHQSGQTLSKPSPSTENYYRLIKNSKKSNPPVENLVKNGGFEKYDSQKNAFDGWNDWKKQLSPSGDVASGARSASIALSEKPKWGPQFVRGILSCPVDLKPGTYFFRAKVKGSNLTDIKVKLVTKDGKASKSSLKVFNLRNKNPEDWKEFSALLKVPAETSAEKLGIEFLGERGKQCEALIDDVKLTEQKGSSNVMFNSSFEICTVPGCPDRWSSDSCIYLNKTKYNTIPVFDTARTGSNSVKMSWHGPYSFDQAYYNRLNSGYCPGVDKGAEFTASLWMKTDNPPVKMNLWMNYVNRKEIVVDSKEWKKYSFTSVWRQPWRKQNFAFILLFFAGKEDENINANVWVDDVTVVPGKEAADWAPSINDEIYLDKMFAKNGEKSSASKGSKGKAPSLEAVKTAGESIKIDGKLNEKAWGGKDAAECLKPFKKTPCSNSTLCRVAYDDDFIYIALNAKRKTVTAPSKGSKKAFADDWVEFFLDPNSADYTYYQFVINRDGNIFTTECRFDPIAFETPGSSGYDMISWKPEIERAVSEDKEGWKAELKIPLNLFASQLNSGKPFKMNFYRVISASGEANCWSKTRKGFHDIPCFGILKGFNSQKDFSALEFSDIKFFPSPDGSKVTGKLSLSGNTLPEALSASIIDRNHNAEKLNVTHEGNTYTLAVPLPPRKALNKSIRIKAKINGETVQAFTNIAISKLLILGTETLTFRDENAFSCLVTVNLPRTELEGTQLKLSAVNKENGEKTVSASFKAESGMNIVKLPLKKLSDGWYDITAGLTKAGKSLAEETKWTYLGKRRENYTRVEAENMRLETNGRPFFLKSTWNVLRDPVIDYTKLSKFKELGFNTIVADLGSYRFNYKQFDYDKLFDEAEKAGLYVTVDLTGIMGLGERKHKLSRQQILDTITSFVKKYRDRPNLLMYHGMDEWVAGRQQNKPFCLDEDLEEVYWLVKKLDPYHPFFFNLGPRVWAWGDLRFTDIFSYDCYVRSPDPYETNMERFEYYALEGDKCAVKNGKPMFIVIQLSSGTEVFQTRMMRFNEQRCLTYVTLLNSSRGILFYTGPSWCEAKNEHMRVISKEIDVLSPVLLGYEKQGRVTSTSKNIKAKYFLYEGHIWVLCANLSSKALNGVELDLSFAGMDVDAEPVFNGTSETLENGKLKLDFPQYGCFAYKIKTAD